MSTTIETFKPLVACSEIDLHDGIAQGLWLSRSLFSALIPLISSDDRHEEMGALSFLGEAIAIEVEAKHGELVKRTRGTQP